MFTLSTKYFSYSFASDGRNIAFIDLETGENHIKDATFCAYLTDNEKNKHYPVSVGFQNNIITVEFDNGIKIETITEVFDEFITFTLKSVSSEDFHAVAFINIEVNTDYSNYSLDMGRDGFTATLMGLNVHTRMAEYPGRNTHLCAEGYPHIGLLKTKRSKQPVAAAVIGKRDSKMRDAMKKVMEIIPEGELPKSKLGGAYAYDIKDARRTYTNLLEFDDTDKIIPDLKRLGITEIGIHQGIPYRQGDFRVNPELYPNGIEDFKEKIRIYHENGIRVNLHSYTFFLDHKSSYVTPVPHPELDHICELKLTKPLDEVSTTIYVDSLEGVADVYSGGLVSSKYIQIGQELIRFGEVDKENNAFINCERGTQKTYIASHKAGDKVCQLKEYFCFIAPRAGSSLFYEIARNTAEFFNECDLDGFYLDAIDGVFALEGNDYAWYHAMDFINEMFKHLKKDPIFGCCYNPQYTASWYVRSRYGAFDSATRAHRDYIDAHTNYNMRMGERMYLPTEHGWFDLYNDRNLYTYGWQAKLMPTEDVEYLCAKILGSDCSMCYRRCSIFDHENIPMLDRYSEIVRAYNRARYSGEISPELRHRLVQEGTEFTLLEKDGKFTFYEAETKRRKLESLKEGRNGFTYNNRFDGQAPFIRIEPLYSAGNYDEEGIVLKEFDENRTLSGEQLYELGEINSYGNNGLGVWVYGDGSGVSVKISLHNRIKDSVHGNMEFYVKCDFTGWRYFAFYEAQNGDAEHTDWARCEMVYKVFTDVGKFYSFYRDHVDFSKLAYLKVSVNTDKPTKIRLRTIKLLPYYENVLENPILCVNGQKLIFKCSLHPETQLSLTADGKCEVIDYEGHILETPGYIGELPVLREGANEIMLLSDEKLSHTERAEITVRVIGGEVK